ncbi:type II secretion system F family protein [Streptomyces sp. B8F3]|uniref:type II secretion system F family protein n=1 Tax=Streptomyces sp. B8F3 TaxID=3153573 RepID=UPI00325CB0C7
MSPLTALPVLAAAAGLGLWALLVWLVPPRPALAELVAAVRAAPSPQAPMLEPTTTREDHQGWAARLGRPLVGPLRAAGLPRARTRRDLAITGRTVDVHLAEKAALAVAGLLLPLAAESALSAAGSPNGWITSTGAGLALGIAGFLAPDMSTRAEAARRRKALRHALSAYLDLVHILLSGGAGATGALYDAATVGQGWAFGQLRRALNTAQATRTAPWQALAQLGEELAVRELSELAASLSLAGSEGAKVRASLAAKAAAMRSRSGAEAEVAATTASERMAFPTALMAFGFVLFILYAAMSHVTSAL